MRSRSVPTFRFRPTFLNIQVQTHFPEQCNVCAKLAALYIGAHCVAHFSGSSKKSYVAMSEKLDLYFSCHYVRFCTGQAGAIRD